MSVLDRILEKTRDTITRDRHRRSAADWLSTDAAAIPCRGFVASLAAATPIGLIAEIKRASPSAGLIRDDFDPSGLAKQYRDGGATCLSVLTDEPFFQGSLDFIADVRATVDLPVLRKDFLIDPYQIDQARGIGADCVLLIAECLPGSSLAERYDQATRLGMDVLIELYDQENLDRVLQTGCPLVGVNNRNLRTFQTDLSHTVTIGAQIPDDRILVGESGIHTHDDVQRLMAGGARAILVGESLMRESDVASATRRLLHGGDSA